MTRTKHIFLKGGSREPPREVFGVMKFSHPWLGGRRGVGGFGRLFYVWVHFRGCSFFSLCTIFEKKNKQSPAPHHMWYTYMDIYIYLFSKGVWALMHSGPKLYNPWVFRLEISIDSLIHNLTWRYFCRFNVRMEFGPTFQLPNITVTWNETNTDRGTEKCRVVGDQDVYILYFVPWIAVFEIHVS